MPGQQRWQHWSPALKAVKLSDVSGAVWVCALSLSLKNNKFKRLNNDTSTLIYTTHDDLFK